MYREIVNDLAEWKEKSANNILYLNGAKSVGKTWIAKDFALGMYEDFNYIELSKDTIIRDNINEPEFSKAILKKALSFLLEKKETLNIIDDIDFLINKDEENGNSKCLDNLIEILKEYKADIIIIGIKDINEYENIDKIRLNPLSFGEFLIVSGRSSLSDKITKYKEIPLSDEDIKILQGEIKNYYIVGGMPEAVLCFIETKDIKRVKEIQNNILYRYLFIIEDLKDIPLKTKVIDIWKSIPKQLEKENKKFMFSLAKLTARAREYQEGIDYLLKENLIDLVYKIKSPKDIPQNIDFKSYKAYLVDIGILSFLYNINIEDLEKDEKLSVYNNALTEQFVFQELLNNKQIKNLYYWTSSATAKIDFVFKEDDLVFPIDINLYDNQKAQSLKVYKQRYDNRIAIRIVSEKTQIGKENDVLDIPLFAIWNL